MRELQVAELCFVSGGGVFCGPQGSWLSNFVPDKPFGVDFGGLSGPCDNHDRRYGEGILPRSQIDSMFLAEALDRAGTNPVGIAMAYVYYGAVSWLGGFFYGPSNSAVTVTDAQAAEISQSTVDYAIAHALGDDILASISATGVGDPFTARVKSGIESFGFEPKYFIESQPPAELAVA